MILVKYFWKHSSTLKLSGSLDYSAVKGLQFGATWWLDVQVAGFEISGGPVARGHQIFHRTTRTLGSSGPTGHWNFPDQNCLKDRN